LAATDLAGPVQLHLASAVGRLADGPAWNVAGALAGHDTFATDAQFPKLVWFGLAPSVARHPDAAVALAGSAALPQLRRNLARWVAGRVDDRPDLVAALRKAGGRTIAEHEKTCVVYGMPRAAIELGVVDLVLPLPQIAGAIVDGVARKPLAAV
jgi:hypothetical protein